MRLLCVVLVVLFASTGRASATWLVTVADAAGLREVRLADDAVQLQDGVATAVVQGGTVRPALLRREADDDLTNPWRLVLRGGQVVAGAPLSFGDERISFRVGPPIRPMVRPAEPRAGETLTLSLPVDQIAALTSADVPYAEAMSEPASVEDVARLSNGDILRGFLVSPEADDAATRPKTLRPDATTFTMIVDGAELPVPLDRLRVLQFADGGAEQDSLPDATLRVSVAGGSMLFIADATLADGELYGTLLGRTPATVSIPLARVRAIEPVKRDVHWLTDRQPDVAEQTPFLTASQPLRYASGAASELSEDPRSIRLHSRGRVAWDLPDGFDRLRLSYAIANDQPRPMADVVVRVLLDDRVVHEAADVTATTPATEVDVALDGAERVTLEVDFGQNMDVQDLVRFDRPAVYRAE
jgi:hypothetical protein